MLAQLENYLLSNWSGLPGEHPAPRRLAFLGQATGVSKACFFVFADDETSPRYIVKTPRSPAYNDELLHEIATVERLRAAVPDRLRATLPGPMHLMRLSGQVVVVEPVLSGQPMDSMTRPNRSLDPATTAVQMDLARSWLVQIQQAVSHRTGPLDAGAVQHYLLDPLDQLRRHTDLQAAEDRYAAVLARQARALEGQEVPLYLYHGDFRAGNILVSGERIAVLDWQFSRPLALPLLDWFSFVFRLYSRAMDLPDIDGPLELYRTVFQHVFFARNWFSELVVDQTRAYCRALGVAEDYLPVLFALFVVTNVNKFHAFLSQRAARGYLYLLREAPTSGKPYRRQIRRQAYAYLLADLALNSDALALKPPGQTSHASSVARHERSGR